MCSVKKVFLEISQNSQENLCARVSFLKKLQPHLIYPQQALLPLEIMTPGIPGVQDTG